MPKEHNYMRCKKHSWYRSPTCGVRICTNCNEHEGLARCFCGWSASGGDGYRELIEMGENIEDY